MADPGLQPQGLCSSQSLFPQGCGEEGTGKAWKEPPAVLAPLGTQQMVLVAAAAAVMKSKGLGQPLN